MWIRVLLFCSVCAHAWTQDNHVNSPQGGASVGWGWQVNQAGPGTVGHYFVKLPESEQQVRYVADGSGYHSALAVVTGDQHHSHTANFALGQRAIDLSAQIPSVFYQNIIANNTLSNTNTDGAQTQQPVEIYLLQQHYPLSSQINQQTNDNNIQYNALPQFYYGNIQNPVYYDVNLEQTHPNQYSKNKNENRFEYSAKNLQNIDDNAEQTEDAPIVRVFKDQNCLKNTPDLYANNIQKSTDIVADLPVYKEQNIHGHFGERDLVTKPSLSHNFNIQTQSPRHNARNERYYYTTEFNSPSTTEKSVALNKGGISRLVESTQDLISNDDLLRINYSVEKLTSSSSDDIIKPQRRAKSANKKPMNQFTITAKYGNIVENQNYNTNNNNNDQEISEQAKENEYRFSSPIVVDDSSYHDYKKQIVNNLVSTMVPYIEDGYEIIGVKNTFNESYTNSNDRYNPKDLVAITPRPIDQSYLAPITVALRLFNSNNTNIFNSDGDHDVSDSEFITNTVESPRKDKVTVEVQESIPVEITHINEVEYHQYLDEGRSNTENPLNLVKTLYQKYVESLETSRNNNENSDDNGKYYSSNNHREKPGNEDANDNDSKETLEPSENIRSEVQIQGNRYINYYDTQDRGKIIQPIVIEKQVPVTTYVDRFIEKQVPYPEPVEVVKQVPVDRPVPVPVHYERIVEKPVEVTRYVDKPYPVEVFQPYPVEIRVPYPVEHKIYVDRPVHVPYPVEKIIEKQLIHHIPVPTPVAVPIGVQVPVEKKVLYPVAVETPVAVAIPVEKQVPVEKVVQRDVPVPYPVEKRIPYPITHEVKVPYPVEKRIPVPVEKIVEKPVTITKVVEKPVHIKVPHPVPVEVHVPKPYPVDRIVEKKVPYPVPVDRIVERKVPIQVPYPVKTFVEKIVDRPIYVTKYIDKPYPVEKRIPYPVDRIVEKRVPYPVEVSYEKNNKKPDTPPYPFEKVESAYLYGYGSNPGYIHNDAHRLNQQRFKESIQSYLQGQAEQGLATQQQAESQRNYQIQSTNAQLQRNIQNMTPVYSTQWGNQYASSFQYINATTENNKRQTLASYLNQVNDQRYNGPPPLKKYNDLWNNKDNTESFRHSERSPKVANLRIEYGFKPPMVPSIEVDLDGLPINRNKDS